MRKREIVARLPCLGGLGEPEAAAFLSLSQSFFRELVAAGELPKPRTMRGRKVYDVEELIVAFRTWPREGDDVRNDTSADFE